VLNAYVLSQLRPPCIWPRQAKQIETTCAKNQQANAGGNLRQSNLMGTKPLVSLLIEKNRKQKDVLRLKSRAEPADGRTATVSRVEKNHPMPPMQRERARVAAGAIISVTCSATALVALRHLRHRRRPGAIERFGSDAAGVGPGAPRKRPVMEVGALAADQTAPESTRRPRPGFRASGRPAGKVGCARHAPSPANKSSHRGFG